MTDNQIFSKDWLNRDFSYYREIEALQQKAELMENDINRCVGGYEASEIQRPDYSGIRESKMSALADLKNLLEAKTREMSASDMETIRVIDKLSGENSHNEKSVLIYRYVNRQQWKTIARDMQLSEAKCYEIHDLALEDISPIIKEHLIK